MKPSGHIITSLSIGGLVYLIWHSISAAMISIVGGVLLDIDHLLDYFMIYGFSISRFSFKKFYTWAMDMKSERLYLFLHSFEFLLILWLATFIFRLGNFWLALNISVTVHILLDQFFNPTRWFSYFLTFRIFKGFRTDAIFRPEL